MSTHNLKKGNVKVTLSINKKVWEDYKRLCEEEGIINSKQVEKFMKEHKKKREICINLP